MLADISSPPDDRDRLSVYSRSQCLRRRIGYYTSGTGSDDVPTATARTGMKRASCVRCNWSHPIASPDGSVLLVGETHRKLHHRLLQHGERSHDGAVRATRAMLRIDLVRHTGPAGSQRSILVHSAERKTDFPQVVLGGRWLVRGAEEVR